MITRHFGWVAVALGIALAPTPARAQRGIDVDKLSPALDHQGFLGIQATRTPGPFRWNVGLVVDWSTDPLTGRDGDTRTSFVRNRVNGHFLFQLGLGGRFALGLDLPLVLFQDGDPTLLGDGLGALPTTALADPRISLRWRFLGEDSRVERERNEGEGVALAAAITPPLGTDRSFAAERGTTSEIQAIGDFHLFGAGIGAMLGWRHRTEPEIVLGTEFRDDIQFGLALKLPIPVTRDFLGILEVRGTTDPEDFFGSQTVVEGDLGLRFTRGDVSVTGSAGLGFTSGVGSPGFRGLLGLYWSPRVRDADGDGIPDDQDECEYLPEDFDGFEDSDGCLDPDNDGDLIPDTDDQCPNETAEEFHDEDEDGCTDPRQDRDGDGIEDAEDACPAEPEDMDGHDDDDGCPEPDNDGDGIPDTSDQCPDAPEDRDGYQDDDGCPDPDDDGDGIVDADDRCPRVAEDRDGNEDEDGCPDLDDDHDGVLDADDHCPGQLETINGVDDGDGCPDRGGRSLFHERTEPGSGAITVTGSIRFDRSDAIASASSGAVDQLARHVIRLGGAPIEVAIGTEVPGRLEALKTALTDRGVPPSTFTIVHDPSVTGARVVVRRAPTAQPSAHETTPDPAAETAE